MKTAEYLWSVEPQDLERLLSFVGAYSPVCTHRSMYGVYTVYVATMPIAREPTAIPSLVLVHTAN